MTTTVSAAPVGPPPAPPTGGTTPGSLPGSLPASGTQATVGAAGGGAAAPTGAGQAAAGVTAGGTTDASQAQLIEALKSLIAVLNQLVAALSAKAGTTIAGGPTDTKAGGPPPTKVAGAGGDGIVQQSPIQAPVKAGGGMTAVSQPSMPGRPATSTPTPGAQPVAGGGATAAPAVAHSTAAHPH